MLKLLKIVATSELGAARAHHKTLDKRLKATTIKNTLASTVEHYEFINNDHESELDSQSTNNMPGWVMMKIKNNHDFTAHCALHTSRRCRRRRRLTSSVIYVVVREQACNEHIRPLLLFAISIRRAR